MPAVPPRMAAEDYQEAAYLPEMQKPLLGSDTES